MSNDTYVPLAPSVQRGFDKRATDKYREPVIIILWLRLYYESGIIGHEI